MEAGIITGYHMGPLERPHGNQQRWQKSVERRLPGCRAPPNPPQMLLSSSWSDASARAVDQARGTWSSWGPPTSASYSLCACVLMPPASLLLLHTLITRRKNFRRERDLTVMCTVVYFFFYISTCRIYICIPRIAPIYNALSSSLVSYIYVRVLLLHTSSQKCDLES